MFEVVQQDTLHDHTRGRLAFDPPGEAHPTVEIGLEESGEGVPFRA